MTDTAAPAPAAAYHPMGGPRANNDAEVRGFGAAIPTTDELVPVYQHREAQHAEPVAWTEPPYAYQADGPKREVSFPVAWTLAPEYVEAPPLNGVQSRPVRQDSGMPVGEQDAFVAGESRAVVRPIPGAWDAGFRAGPGAP